MNGSVVSCQTRVIWFTPDRFDIKPDKSSWLEMAQALRAIGWNVTIVAAHSKDRQPLYPNEVEYLHVMDRPLVFRISALIAFCRWLRRQHGERGVVIVNPDAMWIAPFVRLMGGSVHLDVRTLPVVSAGIKGWLDRLVFWTLALRLFVNKAESFSFITKRLQNVVEQELGMRFEQAVEWQSGVNLERFCPSRDGAPAHDAPFRVVYHGSISRKRGIHQIVEAMAVAPFPFAVELLILGDGPDREEMQRLSTRLGLERIVQFRGLVPYEEVVETVRMASVCICPLPDLPEWNVSSPLKVFEYMACEKPMILTPIPAHLDLLDGCNFVIWSNGYAAQDFHEAILRAHAGYEGFARAAGLARDQLKGRFEWSAQAAKLASCLERVVAGWRAAGMRGRA